MCRKRSQRTAMTCGVLAFVVSFAMAGGAFGQVVHPGDDVWHTLPGTTVDFFVNPIPADFFFPGSLPFDGVINLRSGCSNDPNEMCGDTIVQRITSANLPTIGSSDTIPIELIELNLVSTAPITINPGAEQWEVSVTLPPGPPPAGTMTITKEHANGGTYSAGLSVQPRFTFTRISGGPPQTAMIDRPYNVTTPNPIPWTVHPPPGGALPGSGPDFFPSPGYSGPLFRDAVNGYDQLGTPARGAAPQAPSLAGWGLALLSLSLLVAGVVVIRRRRLAQIRV